MLEFDNFRYISDFRYTADRDLADAYKLEVSCLSPAQDRRVKNVTKTIEWALHNRFGKFFREDAEDELLGVENRVLITDRDTYNVLFEEMHGQPDPGSFGTHYKAGRLIHVLYPECVLQEMMEEHGKEFILNQLRSAGSSVNASKSVLLIEAISHELSHEYQYILNRPGTFFECGARYYSRVIMQDLGMSFVWTEDLDEKRLRFFQELIEKYGDDVHRIFFGSHIKSMDFSKVVDILSEVTPEVMDELQLELEDVKDSRLNPYQHTDI